MSKAVYKRGGVVHVWYLNGNAASYEFPSFWVGVEANEKMALKIPGLKQDIGVIIPWASIQCLSYEYDEQEST